MNKTQMVERVRDIIRSVDHSLNQVQGFEFDENKNMLIEASIDSLKIANEFLRRAGKTDDENKSV